MDKKKEIGLILFEQFVHTNMQDLLHGMWNFLIENSYLWSEIQAVLLKMLMLNKDSANVNFCELKYIFDKFQWNPVKLLIQLLKLRRGRINCVLCQLLTLISLSEWILYWWIILLVLKDSEI